MIAHESIRNAIIHHKSTNITMIPGLGFGLTIMLDVASLQASKEFPGACVRVRSWLSAIL